MVMLIFHAKSFGENIGLKKAKSILRLVKEEFSRLTQY
jgi:hypothetical protein